MKRALITGITGFTGGHLAKFLSELGLEIYGLALPSVTPRRVWFQRNVCEMYYVDVRDRIAVSEIMCEVKPDYLFHLAGAINSNDFKELIEVNVMGTQHILEATLDFDTRILVPGSAAEYGAVRNGDLPITESTSLHPINIYGVSKVSQTTLAYTYFWKYGSQVYIARPFNLTGPGEPTGLVCSSIAEQIIDIQKRNTKPIISIGNLETKRDFTDVRDVVKGYWSIVENGTPGEVYNVCSGKAYSIKEIVHILSYISGVEVEIKQDVIRVRLSDIPLQIGQNRKIEKDTGWRPAIELKKSLEDLIRYHQRKFEDGGE